GKMADGSFLETKHGDGVIADDRAHAFAALADVRLSCWPHAFLFRDADAGITPLGIAGHIADQIHEVGAKHHQVLPAGTAVFLAASAYLQDVADQASAD